MPRDLALRRLMLVEPTPDHEASSELERVFRAHARYVSFIALRVLGRDQEVDDVVQDVFLSAVRRLRYLREPAALKAWLGTAAVRVARRKLRARWLQLFFGLNPEPDYGELAAPDAS